MDTTSLSSKRFVETRTGNGSGEFKNLWTAQLGRDIELQKPWACFCGIWSCRLRSGTRGSRPEARETNGLFGGCILGMFFYQDG